MDLVKALPLIVTGYVMSNTAAWARDQCPAGPFETDVRVIAAAIASHPLRPRVWDASPEFFEKFPEQLTDGAFWSASGGLANTSGQWLYYDAKRYVAVSVVPQWGSRRDRIKAEYAERLPNQLIHRDARGVYTTTITRPTPAQARQFACLTNRLAAPAFQEDSSSPAQPVASPGSPPKGVRDGREGQNCSSEGMEYHSGSDEWSSMFELHSSGSVLQYDTALPCATRTVLVSRLEELSSDLIDESIAQGKGKWRGPYVHDLATDAADNLYLLVNPGTLRPFTIDIRKITPSGEVTHLPVYIGEMYFYGDTFSVDGHGHAWVPVTSAGVEVDEVSPDSEPDPGEVALSRVAGAPDSPWSHAHIDSIVIGANQQLFGTCGSEILEIAPPSAVTPFVDTQPAQAKRSSSQPSHIAVAADGTLFVSDSSSHVIFKVTPEKVVTIFAGTPGKVGTADGPGSTALFNSPKGLVVDREGTLYVADSGNQTIRRITRDGQVSTFVGRSGKRGTVDGQGEKVRLDRPASIAIDSTGRLYVASGDDNRIRKISPAGVVSTLDAQQFIDAP
jgi:hypothetical protein